MESINNDLIVCVNDYERMACEKLDKTVADYFNQGADEELTLKLNKDSFNSLYLLRPRLMRNVQDVDISTTVFGDKIAMPIGISPTALQKVSILSWN